MGKFAKRHSLLLSFLALVLIGLPQGIQAWVSLWDRFPNVGVPTLTIQWQWEWLFRTLGFILFGFILFVIIPELIPLRNRAEQVKEPEKDNNLQIRVQRSDILEYYPKSTGFVVNPFSQHNIVEVQAEFHPKGDTRLHSIELHTGRHVFQAKHLPVVNLDRDAIYHIPFEGPTSIIEHQRTSNENYLRVLFNDTDCRSDNFPFYMAYEVDDKRYLMR